MASDLAAFPPAPPLAFNAALIAMARTHTNDLVAHNGVGLGGDAHNGYDGSTPASRYVTSGYDAGYVGENVAAGATSLDNIHRGYLIDWGVPSLGHRKTSMTTLNAEKEIGMGLGTLADQKLVETEDFGKTNLKYDAATKKYIAGDVASILTGVVYHDANGNGEYDPGEGVAGATVTMDGGKYYTLSSASGGYALPLVNADSTFADGTVQVSVTSPDGSIIARAALPIQQFTSAYGAYRGNVAWEVVTGDTRPPGGSYHPDLPRFAQDNPLTVKAGETIKLRVLRPDGSDLSQPYSFGCKTKGPAVPGVDYKALPGTVTIPAGAADAKLKIRALAGSGNQSSLTVKLKGVPGAQGKATVTFVP